MAQNFPFETNADKYSRQLWSKQAYLYLAEFFRKAVFDTNVQLIEGGTIDDYRFSGPAEDWRLPGGGGGGGSTYSSYFKVSTETSDLGCFIIVTDGGEEHPVYSGAVKINGVRVDVDTFAEIQSVSGLVYVWLYSYMMPYGPAARVVTTNPLTFPYPLPGNPDGGLVYACQLLGRVTIAQNADGTFYATSLNQDYLHGGEHVEHLWAQCELAEDEGE